MAPPKFFVTQALYTYLVWVSSPLGSTGIRMHESFAFIYIRLRSKQLQIPLQQSSILVESMVMEHVSGKEKIILAVGAHPDDMDFGASATIARFVQEGATAYYIVATDGSRGSGDPEMTHEHLAEIRKEEQLAAARALGIKEVFFLGHTDTQLLSDLKLKEQITRIIREVRPNIVITMDPTFYYAPQGDEGRTTAFINHTDHRAVALATMDAVFPLSRDRLTFPEHEQDGLMPHRAEELWFTAIANPHYLSDVTHTFNKKMEALKCHASQYKSYQEIHDRMKTRAKTLGKELGVEYAEGFVRLLMP